MKKFRAGGFSSKLIEAVEVDRETDVSVFIDKQRHAKRSSYHNYFDTWDEAKDFLLKKAEGEAERIRRLLEIANGKLGHIRGLRNQEETNGNKIQAGQG